MDSESKLCSGFLENLTNENEQNCSLNPETASVENVGAQCNKGLRVKVITEINENSDYSNKIKEVNKTDGSRKRDAACADHTTSKRCKLSEEETSKSNGEPQEKGSEFQNEREAENTADSNTAEVRNLEENNCVVKVKVECSTDSSDELNINNVPTSSGSSNQVDIKPAVKVEKAEASSTLRQSCRFGIRCYRRNPMHRSEEAHPGDHDYRRPIYPPPPKGTPECPFGDQCYRRNPIHFEQFNHPPETDFEQNYKNYRLRQRQRQQQRDDNTNINNSELDDDSEDPFNDEDAFDSDYVPNSDDEDDEDYDACDKAEE
ncbi:aprataxin and PNK-like factor [Bactrocera tryoni]|uniref:aprataxin and PNK-like factor n=1 Tax=Bactrocera tryoni TaxID=59916 RepID=UPI001A978252|nr:aprataxin and PNK-like factor [Bactrocera tryoni]